ncbi:iron-containing alcohol dehydrogenase [Arthrobacter bambusae]|uniref:iron-containing alcohol dehydrogenase family protein n=1 Tax=Arthrobacter bambusae TaxID=1338426 RepID=UPI001F513CB3|nr:iron-containing alcohol dehydrogenase family protein [Arthrobacter bambusae]MCI0143014.1 iron-containing alcohol dehydrogenase [Arthrobacter bambusae]
MNEQHFRHATPEFRTFWGEGALTSLPGEMKRVGSQRAAIICSASMLRYPEALAKVEAALGDRLVGRFEGAQEHSPLPAVENARSFLSEVRADAIIVVGGGSAIVTARAASILLAEQADVRELCTRRGPDGRLVSPRLTAPKVPQWIVPTTPTTAYAKAGCAVRDPATGERLALFDPKARAQGVFFDPMLALTAPAPLVQSSALNAFAMSIDGLQSDTDDPLAHALLMHALRLLVEWLPEDSIAPDPQQRLRLMHASLLAGQGSDYVGTGLAQALSHTIGPRSSTANGVVEAMLLPHTMRFNAEVVGTRLSALAPVLNHGGSRQSTPERVVATTEEFLRSRGVPGRLRDVGIARDSLDAVVDHAMEDWAITRVPRRASREELTKLLEGAW